MNQKQKKIKEWNAAGKNLNLKPRGPEILLADGPQQCNE